MASRTSRKSTRLLLITAGLIVVALVLVKAQSLFVSLEAGMTGVGLVGERFMIAVPIVNDGTLTAASVQVTGATFGIAPRLSPAAFPVALGPIAPDNRAIFQADFNVTGLQSHTQLPLTITGTYQVNEVTFSFTLTSQVTLPERGQSFAPTGRGQAPHESLNGSPYPPGPIQSAPDDAEPGPPVPTGPYVPGTPSALTSVQDSFTSSVTTSVTPSVSAVSIKSNQGLKNLICNGCAEGQGDPDEPSGASGGGVAFMSFNWGAVYQVEGSSTFTTVDPHTIFPHSPQILYSFCCDQVVEYSSKIDRFLWVQQLTQNGGGSPGAYRLAAARPADIEKYSGQKHAWDSWLFVPEQMNFNHVTEFDRPSMSVGDNYLYIAWDQSCPKTVPRGSPCVAGREIIRVPLRDIKAGGTLHYDYLIDPSFDGSAWGDNQTEETGDAAFWLGQNGTSSMLLFWWPETANIILESAPITVSSWVVNWDPGDTDPTHVHVASNAPNPVAGSDSPPSRDWLYRSAAQWIPGAARSGNHVWFAWNSAPHDNFPQPYIEMLDIDINAFANTKQMQIWNANFAFGIPALASNACTGEIGLSLAYGGGSHYPNHAVGFWGDYVVYPTTNGSVTGSAYGDYLTIRRNHDSSLHGAYFDAFGYALVNNGSAGSATTLPASAVDVDTHHTVFGRPGVCGQ